MDSDAAHCEACGATVSPTDPTCTVCGRDNTEHLTKLGLVDPPEEPAPEPEPEPEPEPGVEFSPAPHIPAPLRAAVANPEHFKPVTGKVISGPSPEATVQDLEGFDEDQIPSWVYRFILFISIVGFFGAFLYWNSSSPIIGPGWKAWALGLMLFFGITGLIVAFRLGRKEEYGKRSVEFAKRRKDGTVRFVKGAATGFASAGKGVAQSGASFGKGFQESENPNFIVKFIRWIIRTIVRTILGIVSLIKSILRLVLAVYILVVRIGWWLYRGIVEPVLRLAFRIVRWALKVTYRVSRWALRIAWRVVYWITRRFPFKYIQRPLEEPMRFHVYPKVLVTNVIVSEALGAPVKERVAVPAEPHVARFRLHHQTQKAIKLLEKQDEYEKERPMWLTVPTPEERRARREEKKRQKAEAIAAEKQAKIDAKLAEKEAKQREKEEMKKAKEEGRLDEYKQQMKEEEARRKEEEKAAKLAAKGKADKAEAKAKKAEEKEAQRKAKEEAKAAKKAEKEAKSKKSKKEIKAEKKREAQAKKAEQARAKKEAKADKKDKKKNKGEDNGDKSESDGDASTGDGADK